DDRRQRNSAPNCCDVPDTPGGVVISRRTSPIAVQEVPRRVGAQLGGPMPLERGLKMPGEAIRESKVDRRDQGSLSAIRQCERPNRLGEITAEQQLIPKIVLRRAIGAIERSASPRVHER